MRPYFKPLRRKIGVITLVMACVFTAGWIRSVSYLDEIVCSLGRGQQLVFDSVLSHIVLKLSNHYVGQMPRLQTIPAMMFKEPADTDSWVVEQLIHLQPLFHGFGFGVDDGEQSVLVVPYWSIVVPLTFLSACLLLSKPRVATLRSLAEPSPPEAG